MRKVGWTWRLTVVVAIAFFSFASAAQATTYTVAPSSADTAAGTPCATPASGTCSLRGLIEYENRLSTTPSPVDTIVVPAGSYSLTNGALVVSQSVIIAGAGPRTTSIYQQTTSPISRVFDISASTPAHVVTISGLGVYFGRADSTNGFFGGDIRNQGKLTLSNDLISHGGTTAGSGAGVANDGGNLTITHSLVTTNISASTGCPSVCQGGDSGGIANIGGTQAAQLVVDNSTITSNTGDEGGGLMSWGNAANTVQISDSTITGNTDTHVRTNQVNSGGLLSYGGGQISVQNSIVALNNLGTTTPTTVDCATGASGTIASGGYNLESGTDCGFTATGDHLSTDPGFITGGAEDLGGNTDVIALKATSAAVDAIPTGAPGCSGTDQRGTARPQGSGCDIGAYELFQGIEGQSLTTLVGAVATNGTTPTIDWGDGSPASTSSQDPSTGRVTSAHTYAEEGAYSGTIHYFNGDGSPSTQTFAIKLQDAALAGTASPVNAGVATPYSGPVATFTDGDPGGTASDYAATIHWGDGTNTAGTVAAGTAGFTVAGTHTYPTGGHYNMTISIADSGGATATVNAVANVAPTVTAVSPGSGLAAGATTVTITGTGFTGATAVQFGTTPAGSFTVNGATTITATSPAGSGIVDITVTGPGGTSAASSADHFSYIPIPAVTAVSPNIGATFGGTAVTIRGTGFTGASAVTFGRMAATSFNFGTDAQLTAVVPPGTGTVDVTVTTPGGTSATSAADHFSYVLPPAPEVAPSPPKVQSSTRAAFSGAINPDGSATAAYFRYGLDQSLRATPGPTYDQQTPVQAVGSDNSSHNISANVTGLLPHATYHVQLVAANAFGTAYGPDQTFQTLQDPPPPPPTLGQTFDIKQVSGIVFIRPPAGKTLGPVADAATLTKGAGFLPLTEARQIPAGSQIDARAGTLQLVAATGKYHSKRKTGTFGGAIFKATQASAGITKGVTTLTLSEDLFAGAPGYSVCHGAAAATPTAVAAGNALAAFGPLTASAAASNPILQTLHAKDHNGKFRTKGRYSAGTVRGTIWDTIDQCAGTLTVVHRGTVDVYDYGRRKTVPVHAGHSYLAKAFRHK
jgi:hypothetical protein